MIQVGEIRDRAVDKVLAAMMARSRDGERGTVTIGDAVWATLEVLDEEGLIQLNQSDMNGSSL